VIFPADEPIVAIVLSLLLQVPPEESSLNVVVAPEQILPTPEILNGRGLTEMAIVVKQPDGSV
jgi:hypothetical protein